MRNLLLRKSAALSRFLKKFAVLHILIVLKMCIAHIYAKRKKIMSTNEKQTKSKSRVRDHGEVFTAESEVNAMLDFVKNETSA